MISLRRSNKAATTSNEIVSSVRCVPKSSQGLVDSRYIYRTSILLFLSDLSALMMDAARSLMRKGTLRFILGLILERGLINVNMKDARKNSAHGAILSITQGVI